MARVALMRHGRAMARGGLALARTVGGSSTCCCEGPPGCAFYYPATMCSPGSCPTPYTVYVCGSTGCVGTEGTFLVPAGEVARTGTIRTIGAGTAWQALAVPDDPAAPGVDSSYIEMEAGASIEFALLDPGLIPINNPFVLYQHDPIFRHRLTAGSPRIQPYTITVKKHGVPIFTDTQRQAFQFEFTTDQHAGNFLLRDLHGLSMVIEVMPGSGPATEGIAFSFGAAVLFLQRPFKNGQVIQGKDGRCFAVATATKYCAQTRAPARLGKWLNAYDGSFDPQTLYLNPTLLTQGWPAFLAANGLPTWTNAQFVVLSGAFGWLPDPGRACGTHWDGSPAMCNPVGPLDQLDSAPVIATFDAGVAAIRAAHPHAEIVVYLGGPPTSGTVDPALWCDILIRNGVSVAFDVFGDARPAPNTSVVIDYLLTHNVKVYLENHTAHPEHYPLLPRMSVVPRARLVESGDFLHATEDIAIMQNSPYSASVEWIARGWSAAGALQ